jgi:hypothetical protein
MELKVYTTDKLELPLSYSFKEFKSLDNDTANKVLNKVKPVIDKLELNKYVIITYGNKLSKCSTWLLSKDLK